MSFRHRLRAPEPGGARFDPARHRMAVACAVATAILLAAGGLVTSTGSGLAVPDWPLSFGRFFPPMVGGVLYEHGHRLVAATVGLLTVVLAIWFQLREPRPWVRRLSLLAVGMVVVQGALGGVTVLLRLPTAVSVAHACLAQGFFCLMVALALVTSRGFIGAPEPLADGSSVPLRAVGTAATILVFGQLILGALMRHTGAGLAIPDVPLAFGRLVPPLLSFEIVVHFAHRVGAFVVAAAVGLAAWRALRLDRGRDALAGPARLALMLVGVQIVLGIVTVATRLAVVPATAHLVAGALLLACCLVLTLRAARLHTSGARALRTAEPAGEAA